MGMINSSCKFKYRLFSTKLDRFKRHYCRNKFYKLVGAEITANKWCSLMFVIRLMIFV